MNLITVQFIKDSGRKMVSARDVASRYGAMDRSMRDTGRMIWPMIRDVLSMLTVIFMKANGLTIKHMDEAHISILMALNILVSGLKINNMAMALRRGLMEHAMKETMNMARNTALEHSSGRTLPCSSENSSTITFTERESTCGATVGNTKATGKIIRCMDKAHSHGVTVASTWANTWMTRKTDTESSSGQMEGPTKATGKMVNNMETVCMSLQMA